MFSSCETDTGCSDDAILDVFLKRTIKLERETPNVFGTSSWLEGRQVKISGSQVN